MAVTETVKIARLARTGLRPRTRMTSLGRLRDSMTQPVRALPRGGASLSVGMDEYDRPLRPLSVPEHIDRYKEIDNFIEQFDKFKAVFDNGADPSVNGHLFVVVGDRGYGKTSLRQRCAVWMMAKFDDNHPDCDVVMVDLSDEDWADDTVDARVLRTRNRILDELTGPVEAGDIGYIRTIPDIADSFQALHRKLKTRTAADGKIRPAVPVVLLPGYPSTRELERYYTLARGGMVFIAEIFDEDATRDIKEKIHKRHEGFHRDGVRGHILSLGVLKPGDEALLMAWIQEDQQKDLQSCPLLTNAEVVASLNTLIQGNEVSVSQLMKLLMGVLRIAMARSATEVTTEHILKYYADELFKSAGN